MKRISGAAAFLVCGFAYGQGAPIETTINVLAVELPPGLAAYTTEITQYMANLASHWPNPDGVTVTLMNGGTPIYLSIGIGSGQIETQLQAAKDGMLAQNKRGVADVVLFFSPYVNGACGYARQTNWSDNGLHLFIPNANGVDLNGAEIDYAGIIKTGSGCPGEVALHEFGHLFSAGHSTTGPGPAPPLHYLFPNNHAWWMTFTPPYQNLSRKTIMAQGGIGGYQMWSFSNSPSIYTDNLTGIAYTAKSLANYRNGIADAGFPAVAMCSDGLDNDGNSLADYPSDPGCSSPYDSQEYGIPEVPGCGLTAPIAVTGTVTGLCVPSYPYTSHTATWIDVCPSATESYQIWYSQNAPYTFGWSTLAPIEDIIVWGANSEIKVKACNGSGCSALSSSSYLAISGC